MANKDCNTCKGKGKIFDYTKNAMIPCPTCARKRHKEVADGATEDGTPLNEVLGVETSDLSDSFSYDAMLPSFIYDKLDAKKVEHQKEVLKNLMADLDAKKMPTHSYCFGISSKGRPDLLAYPILAKCYKNQWETPPVVTPMVLKNIFLTESMEYFRYVNAPVVVMLLYEYPTWAQLGQAKSLMQERALKGRPTIFVTTFYEEGCESLLSEDEETYWLAEGVFVDDVSRTKLTDKTRQRNFKADGNEQIDDRAKVAQKPKKSMSSL